MNIWNDIEMPCLYEKLIMDTAREACRRYGITLFQLRGDRRYDKYVKARRFFANSLKGKVGYEQIANFLHRDRTTVYNLITPAVQNT